MQQSGLRENRMNVPIEINKKGYWTSIILGSLIPGLGPIVNKQYFKATMQLIATIFMTFVLLWSLGVFSSNIGKGIFGLVDFGNNGVKYLGSLENDGRFFLVTGTLSVILLVVIALYWIISILNNINVSNLARIGVRFYNWRDQKKLLKTSGLPYLLSLPAIIFILFIVILPLLATIFISFTNINQRIWDPQTKTFSVADGISTPFEWVGFDQFKFIFKTMGPDFKSVLLWTIIWTFGSTITLIVIGTLMAIVVNQNRIKGKTFFRTIYLLPWAIPAFITIMFFSILFQPNGIFNNVIGNKIFAPNTDWLHDGAKNKSVNDIFTRLTRSFIYFYFNYRNASIYS